MAVVPSLIFLVACQDYKLNGVQQEETAGAAIEVTPTSLQFGELPAGESADKTFTIKNVGSETLNVTSVEMYLGSAFTLTTAGVMGRYEPDESRDVTVTWTSSGGEDSGQAVVVSSDGVSPQTFVDLLGGTSVPSLEIDPSTVDFGAVGVGHTKDEHVTLTNVGQAPLTISDISETDAVFSHTLADELPIVLDPGASEDVTVTFAPDASDTFAGQLQVTSDDPDGMKYATLTGEAGSQPIAVCEADPDTVEAIHESTTWKGNASYDPQGYAITDYRWTLISKPTGSAVSMPSGSGANRAGFYPDLVGEYVAQLVVTNELGDRSEPTTCTLTAEPGGDLWIEIYWTHSGDDMDLHLLAPGGTLRTNTDCYYANCVGTGLDWGTRGDSSDNPHLDIDDIPGTGPENINISDPQNGVFTAYVNDYPGSSYTAANDVTMNIYIGGALEWTDTRTITGENHDEAFAEISWPDKTVTPL